MPLNSYVFQEHWIIPAQRSAVYRVLSDGKLLPEWWRGVYLESTPLNGSEVRVGARSRAVLRGALPYRVRCELEATELVQDEVVEVAAHGEFEGCWRATLSDVPEGTRVDINWSVSAQKPIIRYLSPVMKPLFAWNHNWAKKRGETGLTAYLAANDRVDQRNRSVV